MTSSAYTLGLDPEKNTLLRADFAETIGCKKSKSSWMEKFGEWKHKTNVEQWNSDSSSASWTIDVKKPGQYFVTIDYNAWKDSDGGEWDLIAENGSKLRFYTTETTGAGSKDRGRFGYRRVRMGVVTFSKAGSQKLVLKAASVPSAGGMQLHALELEAVR